MVDCLRSQLMYQALPPMLAERIGSHIHILDVYIALKVQDHFGLVLSVA
jgi:hypothetical protein